MMKKENADESIVKFPGVEAISMSLESPRNSSDRFEVSSKPTMLVTHTMLYMAALDLDFLAEGDVVSRIENFGIVQGSYLFKNVEQEP